jgi:hypothetical protein
MGGFPLGDLYHWWNPAIKPGATDYYTSWKAQSAAENTRIKNWLATGKDGGTSVATQPGIPSKYELSQNYPNPFNPLTKIKYSVPQYSNIILKVFDLLGNEIETLVNEEKPAGTYELTWSAASLPSGVYFYQLRAGSFVETKKMMLMK